MTFVTKVVVMTTTSHNGGMNIFQEALIAVWFLTKLGFVTLAVIGAKVVWDKYGHHAPKLLDLTHKQDEDEDWMTRL